MHFNFKSFVIRSVETRRNSYAVARWKEFMQSQSFLSKCLLIFVIIKDAGKLELSYIPSKILCREEEINKIKLYLKAGKVLISGSVGTGKTMLARYIGGDAYVNCYVNKTEHRVLEDILKQLKPRFNPAGLPTQKLWNEIEEGKTIILDEIDGMHADELRHFAYTLSRQYEFGRKIKYIAITRNHFILKQIINDDATWSTFAGKSIVELKPYTWEQIKEILLYRAEESLYPNTYDDDSISFIAEITLNSPGHMRTGIELLRQSAMIAESKGHEKIEIEDIREANREEWMSDIESLDDDETILLLAVATACKNKAYVSVEDIKETLQIKQEEYGMKIENFDRTFQSLLQQGFVYEGNRGYTILDCPTSILIEEIEKKLRR